MPEIDFASYNHTPRDGLRYFEKEIESLPMCSSLFANWKEDNNEFYGQADCPPHPYQFWGSKHICDHKYMGLYAELIADEPIII